MIGLMQTMTDLYQKDYRGRFIKANDYMDSLDELQKQVDYLESLITEIAETKVTYNNGLYHQRAKCREYLRKKRDHERKLFEIEMKKHKPWLKCHKQH